MSGHGDSRCGQIFEVIFVSLTFILYLQCVSVVKVRVSCSVVSMSEVLLISIAEKFATRHWIAVSIIVRLRVMKAPVPRVRCPQRP